MHVTMPIVAATLLTPISKMVIVVNYYKGERLLYAHHTVTSYRSAVLPQEGIKTLTFVS